MGPTGSRTQRRYNIEFSCPAASDQPSLEFETARTALGGLLGDNCNDLLGPVRLSRSAIDDSDINDGAYFSSSS